MKRGEARFCLWFAIAVAAVFLIFNEGAISGSDGESMFQTARSLVVDRDLSVPAGLGIEGRGGHSYSRLGIGLPLLSIPPYLVGSALGEFFGHRSEIQHALVASVTPLICAMLAVSLYALGRRLGAERRLALFVSVGSLVGTFALAYTKEFFSEPLACLGLIICYERFLAKRYDVSAWALALAVVTRPQLAVLVPILFGTVWIVERSWRPLVQFAIPSAVGGAIVAAYNLVRFGGILDFGYQDYGFTAPQTDAIWGFLATPEKSILLFAPITFLLPAAVFALRKSNALAMWLLVANASAVFLVTICVAFWAGGWSWGPRYLLLLLLPSCPALAVWLRDANRIRVASGLFAVGFIISAPTLLVSTRAQQLDSRAEQPTVIRQAELVPATLRYTTKHAYEFTPGGGSYYRTASVWQLGATRILKRNGVLAAAAGTIALVAMASFSARRAYRFDQSRSSYNAQSTFPAG